MPEWDDAVDAEYDFVNDELSTLKKSDRERAFIWDIFEQETTPIDGVLISREQVEDSSTKFDRLTEYGVHDDPELSIPEWLPTISDCGAWGYKELPFPPYGNEGMLEFYEDLDVSTGVTIDHLVLGSGKEKGRLYLDTRAFGPEFSESDLPAELLDEVDVMADEWPEEWPEYVDEYEPSIRGQSSVSEFDPDLFDGSVSEILTRLEDDPRAVYRTDDKQFRYDLTLRNAREMQALYDSTEYDFRLMVAFQGWDVTSYADAAREVLEMGYQYVGIGGVAGSPVEVVRDVVAEVGSIVKEFERTNGTRIDDHVFGFAKTDAFETIGRSGVTSFDSASMLRAAWTGGKNYHLDADQKFDAIRVRYGAPGESLESTIEKSLRGQELLRALRAYGRGDQISTAVGEWTDRADQTLTELLGYLDEHRHDERYDLSRVRDTTAEFRDHFHLGSEVQGFFGGPFRKRIVKLLRADDPDDQIPWSDYLGVVETAQNQLSEAPWSLDAVEELEADQTEHGTFDQLWPVVESYACSDVVDDEDHLDGYRETLRRRPWEECSCPICTEHGIEAAIFRGNNRNRRRGFHNMYRFYQQFERDLPKLLVTTTPDATFGDVDETEAFLESARSEFWKSVHDLPVAEIAVVSEDGIHEWWGDGSPTSPIERDPYSRYTKVFHYHPDGDGGDEIELVRSSGVSVETFDDSDELRGSVLDRLGYEAEFLPRRTVQSGLTEY